MNTAETDFCLVSSGGFVTQLRHQYAGKQLLIANSHYTRTAAVGKHLLCKTDKLHTGSSSSICATVTGYILKGSQVFPQNKYPI